MNVRELRRKYLAFFESKGHQVVASGSLIPIDVTGRLDESLLFNGAGMVQFKPYFRGIAEPACRRLTDAQKCFRTSDIDSVGDTSHLTFFEMMGNFSFGDYFKEQAIAYSWEFLTSKEWLGLDPKRLSVTVFQEDDEAVAYWSKWFQSVGLDPSWRIVRKDEEHNYWPARSFTYGPPGPCGPNSEMFYWTPTDEPAPEGGYSAEQWDRDEEAGKWLEIWNDVFIQYEWQGSLKDPAKPELGYVKEGMPPLPFQSVDTGMGLERTAAVLGGKGSVYDTDIFEPLLRALESMAPGLKYGAEPAKDSAMRIIADHVRAACFCIADGILPSNTGRGYVLRRLLRRAVLKGERTLGFQELFAYKLLDAVIEAMGDHYTELVDRKEVIAETLRNEEAQFRRTLQQGYEMLAVGLDAWRSGRKSKQEPLDGAVAFKLYDTYGFPLEVTQELAAEEGVTVDLEGYQAAMAEAQERSRGASGMDTVYGGVVVAFTFHGPSGEEEKPTPTRFVGYEATAAQAHIVGALPLMDGEKPTGEVVLALDQTPFYAESGGQVGDTGAIEGEGFAFKVTDVIRQDDVFVHLATPVRFGGAEPFNDMSKEDLETLLMSRLFGQVVQARVDVARRKAITRNHTATHLLHAALREVLGKHVTQAGSLVSPEYLRFDFTHGAALAQEELDKVEAIVNQKTLEALPVGVYVDVPIDAARQMGAMALFGEKYADVVRVVQVGDQAPTEAAYSRELCGGVHVRNTGEIGLFKVLHESSVASGVRRIEAVTGMGAYRWVREQQRAVDQAASLMKANPRDLVAAVEKTLEAVKEERRKREKLAAQGGGAQAQVETIGAVEFALERLDGAEPKDAQLVADRLVENQPGRVGLVALVNGPKLTFVCKVGDKAKAAGAHAGNLVREVAKVAGGGGGGRPDFATAGGKDVAKLDEALAAARTVLAQQVGA